MNILSIQSAVAYGHVGNSAAVLPLQLLGHEVWPVATLQFSNHPGYGAWRGRVFPAADIADIVEGVAQRGVLPGCAALLSGYLGEAATGEAVLAALARLRDANPRALYCCDPVMGDDGKGIYVKPGIAEFFRDQALPQADILTPNRFELEALTERPAPDLAATVAAARLLLDRGPRLVAVTSLRPPALPDGRVGALVASRDGAWLAHTPEIAFATVPNGMGDVFAALLLGRILNDAAPPRALSLAISGLFALLERTRESGERELALVAARDDLIAPPRLYPAENVADSGTPA